MATPSKPPAATRCDTCGRCASEVICTLCRTPRPEFTRIMATQRGAVEFLMLAIIVVLTCVLAVAFGYASTLGKPPSKTTVLILEGAQCPLPQPDQVLHITVMTRDLSGRDLDTRCVIAQGQPRRGGA